MIKLNCAYNNWPCISFITQQPELCIRKQLAMKRNGGGSRSHKSLLWMRQKGRNLAWQKMALKEHRRRKDKCAALLAKYEQMEANMLQRISEDKRIYQKHKTSAEKRIVDAENCLVKFVLNRNPMLMESAFSEYILSFLDSDHLKRMKETCKSMLVHIDAVCERSEKLCSFYDHVKQKWRPKLIESTLTLLQ